MAFDWEDYLRFAKQFDGSGLGEAAYRTAVSRSYYAFYGVAAQDYTIRNGPVPRGESSHTVVWADFESIGGKIAPKISQHGRRLKVMRVNADYNTTPAVLQAAVNSAVSTATNGINLLRTLQSGRTAAGP